jgi:hypothetical protein
MEHYPNDNRMLDLSEHWRRPLDERGEGRSKARLFAVGYSRTWAAAP